LIFHFIVSRTVCELCKSAYVSTKHSEKFYDDVTLKDVNILFDKLLIKASEEEEVYVFVLPFFQTILTLSE
jgi:hypothetical protein